MSTMTRKPFDVTEMEIDYMHHSGAAGMFINMGIPGINPEEAIYKRPITCKENFKMLFRGEKPYWMPYAGWAYCDVNPFRPREFADNVAVRVVCDGAGPLTFSSYEGKGWFDLTWVFVPVAGGATVKPGSPVLEDANDWKRVLKWPDLDAIDWTGMHERNREYLNTPQVNQLGILDGLWERLISLMDVSGAAIALIDEDQKDSVKAFFDKYSDFLVEYIRRCKQACPELDSVLIHDDWGHQRGAFFSLETAREMLVPYYQKITGAIHELGMFFELHSCGKNESLVPAYIEMGVDLWCPQAINDYEKLLETYKDEPIWFGPQLVSAVSDEEAVETAEMWFEKYKDYKVVMFVEHSNPIFLQEIYKLSRKYYG